MMKSILTAAVLITALSACGDDKEAAYRKANVDECVKQAKVGMSEEKAQGICECAMDKVIDKYGLVDNVTNEQVSEVLGACVPEMGRDGAG